MRLESRQEIKAYFQGKAEGATLHAWWKDGIQYVGIAGRTLGTTRAELIHLRDDALQAFSEGKEIWTN